MTGLSFSRNQQLALVALAGISLVGLSYGRIRHARPAAVEEPGVKITEPARGGDVEFTAPTGKSSRDREELPSVVVHVAGRVKNPSVYTLRPGSRVVDAIRAAGGPTSDANLDALNLAARVKDGEKILVPSRRERSAPVAVTPRAVPPAPPPYSGTSPASTSGGKLTVPGQGMVNVNTAGPAELERLPGVGPVTAQRIIEYRSEIGRFTSVDQLEEVKGIGPKKLEQMRPFVAL